MKYKHKYKIYFPPYRAWDWQYLERSSCPKDGERIWFHEGYGWFTQYRCIRLIQSEQTWCHRYVTVFMMERTGNYKKK